MTPTPTRHAELQRTALQLERTLIVSLVVVFMVVLLWVATVFPTPRPEPVVRLPFSLWMAKAPETECDPTVSIQPNGALFLGDQPVTPDDLTVRLRSARLNSRCGKPILRVRADVAAPFSAIRTVTRAARESGWPAMTVLVDPAADPHAFPLDLTVY